MNNYKYQFSVVIPIYNVGKYLKDAIESVIQQTIGFTKNLQLILINDGSQDDSEEICLKYKEIYPENIIYIKQKNAGVSVARNNSMQYIEGKYVNFLDGDDKWELDAFEKVYKAFEKNQNEVDILVCRKKFFEAQEGYHFLDYKFEKTKIVNIFEDYDYIHLHITSAFIKSEVVKKYKFDKELKYSEDTNYINEIILDKCRYMILKEATHYYRRRFDCSSAIQNKEKDTSWYTNTINNFYYNLIRISNQKFGKVILYVQYLIMYDLQWRLKRPYFDHFGDEFKEKYIKNIIELLQVIDDIIICEQKNVFVEHKIYALSLKYKKDIKKNLVYIRGKLYFNNIPIFKIRNNDTILKIDILDIEKGVLKLKGRINSAIPKEYFDIYISTTSKENIKLNLEDGKKSIYTKNTYGLNHKILNHYTFDIEIPLKKVKKISFILEYQNNIKNKLHIRFGKFAKLTGDIEETYYAKGKYLIKYNDKNIIVEKNSKNNRVKREGLLLVRLLKDRKFKLILYRTMYYVCKIFMKKDIWLILDREETANDNGEVFYNYILKNKNKDIKSFFVIGTDLSKWLSTYNKNIKIFVTSTSNDI